MPKAIQNLVDGAEFLDRVIRRREKGKILYIFIFKDSFETWTKTYDGHGKILGHSSFIPIPK